MLDEKIRNVSGFPPKLRMLVEHMIASHHGLMEYGSPKVPLFLEAMLLHHLDNLDSKMETVRVAIERDVLMGGNWTGWASSLERTLLKKDRFLAEDDPVATPPAPAPPAPKTTKTAKSADYPTTGSLFAEKLSGALEDLK